jgi:hypothetical protein
MPSDSLLVPSIVSVLHLGLRKAAGGDVHYYCTAAGIRLPACAAQGNDRLQLLLAETFQFSALGAWIATPHAASEPIATPLTNFYLGRMITALLPQRYSTKRLGRLAYSGVQGSMALLKLPTEYPSSG